ncbi:MAG TPA: glycosyltransferase family A protein [Pyrinomonadaceae bacterium]|nr:glycosyltransferase family A protein [Pyrinomonadaceae bacterium]
MDTALKLPLLSVVIPTWNRSRLVCEAIESALAQRPGASEVIVVDDGSTDDTCAVLAERFGPAIKLLRLPQRSGARAARNAGTKLATGELLAFLDSDDLWLPGKLDAELRVFELLPDAEAVISDNLYFIEGQQQEMSRFKSSGLLKFSGGDICWASDVHPVWAHRSAISTCSMTLRRSAVARLGDGPLFADDLTSHEDWDLEIRIFYNCRVAVLPEVWSHVRQFDDGTRPERATPGKTRTIAQQFGFLWGRLEVLERSLKLDWPAGKIPRELERARTDTAVKLARCEGLEG